MPVMSLGLENQKKTEFPGSDVFDTPGRNFFQGKLLQLAIRFDLSISVCRENISVPKPFREWGRK
jgi:hypothetical protein